MATEFIPTCGGCGIELQTSDAEAPCLHDWMCWPCFNHGPNPCHKDCWKDYTA